MKLRTQLLLAFSLLAILPLAAIVFYSFLSSQRAYRDAVEADGRQMAEEMSQQLTVFSQQLRQRIRGLDKLPLPGILEELAATGEVESLAELAAQIGEEIGELKPLLDWVRVIPQNGSPLPEGLKEVLVFETAEPPQPAAVGQPPAAPQPPAAEPLVPRIAPGEAETGTPPGPRPLGREFDVPIRSGEQVVGRIAARTRLDEMIRRSLERAPRSRGEIPFALEPGGALYAVTADDRTALEPLTTELTGGDWSSEEARVLEGWLVVQKAVPGYDVRFGVARPVRESLEQIRHAAVRNLFFGVALVGLAFFGILPLTAHITRHLSALTRGAERIAAGDLQARVPVYSENEIGQLARTFNRMAFELSENQRQLLDQERHRQEQEMHQRLLEAENGRKTAELEEARKFQLSLLPKALPQVPHLDLAVYTKTATEVGGDYYDFQLQGAALTVAIGDATGHGARAGTMVAVIKSLFSSRAGGGSLPRFLSEAAATIKRMELYRMAMALALVRIEGRRLAVSSAGMPPVLLYRRALRQVEEIALPGMPLGGLLGYPYREHTAELEAGDTLLLMTDGFPEMLDRRGEALGYEGVRQLFQRMAEGTAQAIIDSLAAAVEKRSRGAALEDDTTFVVLQMRPPAAGAG